ncbi:M14 family zinc carboxypeptidase [Parapedobacter sp. 10938]|uniref:M14 family zinc carboxypeptidase n=1 Tax=Parapedobacter flavus TaxID=3110225 RepID=UPI002DBCC9BD|nr:M14 family zinc carboxypeptidase [Parapedobacter sp. 10938]MEC3881050.1 M14 family zinc carboxypeptidase [Parapedobacter sp. 10938]
MKHVIHFLTIALISTACEGVGQSRMVYEPDTAMLGEAYETYREASIAHRRFKHADIEPLILKRQGGEAFEVTRLGISVLKKPIYQLRYGNGPKRVMLWSQMHGNEPTATKALMDLFNFLEASGDGMDSIRNLLKNETSLYFIPMLNPDGADVYTRRNAMDVDLNRDARSGATVEGRILINAAKTVEPDYGFNLHDMHIYYNVPGTPTPVTIALLAPAYNAEREVNDVRGDAMKIAAGINQLLQGYVPGGVAKYDDTYSPRAFGDNFQTWGTRTVLIESGGYKGDPEKQFIRKLNFIAILNALIEIAQGSYAQYDIEAYESIPYSDSKLSDVLLRHVSVSRDSMEYTVDLSINRNEYTVDRDYYVQSRISDVGDLGENFGYAELDAVGLHFMPGKIYPKVFDSIDEVSLEQAMDLLRQGYCAIQLAQMPEDRHHALPLVAFYQQAPSAASPHLGRPANFFLAKDNRPVYAVINGYLIDLSTPPQETFKNYVQ